ncbi:hypothetical protein [Phytomonospora endophytica]|uniref:Uncharacterized protein YukE n=1 Tax=Phytomonospora endophytica TaxID=714109 RepID=A0A841FWL5_9ACTN|nr:hypothetical protein [Phytomonospora endophytica]MBB6039143.1 uncharacterized protein YukE [Phytomonospora endophytica]GIG67620.1 hypothetical protein Pen01_39150 [Phytomonospora endophytica]
MPTYATAMASAPTAVASFGTAIQSVSTQLTTINGQYASDTGGLAARWQGEAQQAQQKKATDVEKRVTELAGKIGQGAQAAIQGGQQMQSMVMALRTRSQTILAFGYLIIPPMGLVTIGPVHEAEAAAAGPGAPGVLAGYQAIAVELTAELAAQVVQLTALDAQTSTRLETIVAQMTRNPSAAHRPSGNAWVQQLSATDRASYHRLQGATGRARARSAAQYRASMNQRGTGSMVPVGRNIEALRHRFTGSDIEHAVANDPAVRLDPNIRHTGSQRGGAGNPDFVIGGRHNVDITGGSESSIAKHLGRDYYDDVGQMITYPSLPNSALASIFA